MIVEIRLLTDINNPDGQLLKTLDVDGQSLPETIKNKVGSAIIEEANKLWGHDQFVPVNDYTIFGGYMRNATGDCIVAR